MIDFSRSSALLGEMAMVRLASVRILIVGVGGVGSWCAEALVRTGVRHLTLVDDDRVAPSNVNRQCPATAQTIGQPKVAAMRARLLAINPDAEIVAVEGRYPKSFHGSLKEFDLVIDAIDSVACKAELILSATESGVALVSSLGAALRTDPTKVVLRRFDKVSGDGLARALRQRFKRLDRFPPVPFTCVCSTETPSQCSDASKGSIMPVTCTFGMVLASEAMRLIVHCPVLRRNRGVAL